MIQINQAESDGINSIPQLDSYWYIEWQFIEKANSKTENFLKRRSVQEDEAVFKNIKKTKLIPHNVYDTRSQIEIFSQIWSKLKTVRKDNIHLFSYFYNEPT